MYLWHVVQSQDSSIGEKSFAKALLLRLRLPGAFMIKADPNLAVLVGNTQSYMSTPSAEQTTKSTANPTPIRYRGLSLGKTSVETETIFQKSSLASPPLRPPMAKPGTFLLISWLAQSFRFSTSKPPWTIGNRFCLSGLKWGESETKFYGWWRCLSSKFWIHVRMPIAE